MSKTESVLSDPRWRAERARQGGKAVHSVESYVRQITKRAPELTAEQVDALRAVVDSARQRLADSADANE